MSVKSLDTLTPWESAQLFWEVKEAIEAGHEWYQRAGYIASEDVNRIIRLVEARLLRKVRSVRGTEEIEG